MSLASKIQMRSLALQRVRSFFEKRNIYEVDCPILNSYPALDAFIDVIEAEGKYLHTSPEYRMKELLSKGSGDIYFLGHVFRKEEKGSLHHPEFTMIEYYRINRSLDFLIQETLELIQLFVPTCKVERLSFDQAMQKFQKPCPLTHLSKQEKRHYIWSTDVEPNLQGLTVIDQFPEEEAALAKVINGYAMRFEIYYNGIELANGYDELNNSSVQKTRFLKANQTRQSLDKPSYPIDEAFLASLDGLPPCVGVAIGFDRLMQIAMQAPSIQEVIY